MRKGYIGKVNNEAKLLRYQTALIVEALIGKGNGVRFVMDSWKLSGEEAHELTVEQVRELLKKKRENDELKKIKRR